MRIQQLVEHNIGHVGPVFKQGSNSSSLVLPIRGADHSYQAKYEKDIECGGGYVKIGPKLSDPKAFGDPTPYNIMFGPDKCGYTKRTHLIFNYKGKNALALVGLASEHRTDRSQHYIHLILQQAIACL